MNYIRLRALVIKEFFQIIRDPSSILISIVLPLMLIFVYGYGVSLDLDHLRIGLVLEDDSDEAVSFAESLVYSRYFDVKIAKNRKELEHDMVSGKIRGMVIVPAYFSQFLKTPSETAPIQVIADGSETNTANFVQNYVRGAWQVWIKLRGEGKPLIQTESRFWYNEQLESRNFLIPGSLAIIMTLIGTLLTALVVAREWERGTMEAMLSTPVTRTELLLGKFIPYYLLAVCSMTICVFIAYFLYDVPFRGSLFALWVVTSLFLFASLSLGILVSTIAKNQIVASQIAMVIGFFPAFMLSGFLFEIASMPLPIQWLTYVIPARYFVMSLQTIFLVEDVLAVLIKNCLFMLVLGTILYIVTHIKTVKRLE